MKNIFLGILFLVSATFSSVSIAENITYYDADFLKAVTNKDESLKQAIRNTLRKKHLVQSNTNDQLVDACPSQENLKQCYGHTAVGYLKARQFLLGNYYLVKRTNDYAIREVYCEKEVGSEEFKGKKPGPNLIPDDSVVNIEHTWPQSKFSKRFSGEEQKSDLHHLFPTDSEMNSARSNLEFGMVDRIAKNLKCANSRFGNPHNSDEDVFEPPQGHKGNVARALFYFSVKYELPISPAQEAVLKNWNHEEPVDAAERDRNEAIFAKQYSRNPFVDFPQLADQISDF